MFLPGKWHHFPKKWNKHGNKQVNKQINKCGTSSKQTNEKEKELF